MDTAATADRATQAQIRQLTADASAPYEPGRFISPWREGQATADLLSLSNRWDTELGNAIRRDCADARLDAAHPGDQAIQRQLNVRTPAEARKAAAEIAAELQLRTHLSTQQEHRDDTERAQARHPQHNKPSPTPLIAPPHSPEPYITPEPGGPIPSP